MDDSDLYGALLYIVLYGTFLLLSGKVFYGYIYGVAVFGTVALHLILSLMSPALDAVVSRSASESRSVRAARRCDASCANEPRRVRSCAEFFSAGSRRSERDVSACSFVE